MFMIDPFCKTSIFSQFEKQIMEFIGLGILKSNDQLPSIHAMAYELGINPNKVEFIYQKLESKGYIYKLDNEWLVRDIFIKNLKEEKLRAFNQIASTCQKSNIERKVLLSNTERIFKGGN